MNQTTTTAAMRRARARIPTTLPSVIVTIAMTLVLVALWATTHRYYAFARDGSLYALQALARIHPNLREDVYLQNTSQDQFTVFSPLYAQFIRLFGLGNGELILYAICLVIFLTATGIAARQLSNSRHAWLTVGLFIITAGYYGAGRIFSYSEDYLSARSLGEALVATAIAIHLCGFRWWALSIAVLALSVHPLMVLPGVLLLLCLNMPSRFATLVMAAGVMATLTLGLLASRLPGSGNWLSVMDPRWLEVVRERSQFLFLRYWKVKDWEPTVRAMLCLGLSYLVLPSPGIRKLCIAALLVGISGLAVDEIAGELGPVAILLQGQAWRWMWVTTFVSVLLLVPTAFALWREERGGPLAALLLVGVWVYSDVDSVILFTLASVLWFIRPCLTARAISYLRWGAGGVMLIVAAAIGAEAWNTLHGALHDTSREARPIAELREVFDLVIPAAACAALAGYWLTRHRSWLPALGVALGSLAVCWTFLPGSVKQLDPAGSAAQVAEFSEWRLAIPPESNVLLLPARKSVVFIWFTLERPSYLSVDQSAGVVFSPITAEEIRRRAQNLLPIAKPDWQVMTEIKETMAHPGTKLPPPPPLTASQLSSICRDPALGFVIAKETVGFNPLRHTHNGPYKDWNLYDCRHVRALQSAL